MNSKKLLLVQGHEDALYFSERFQSDQGMRWIAYDALAQQVLKNAAIPYSDESFYLAGDTAYLKGLTTEAHRLSLEIFKGLWPETLEIEPESLLIRALNYYLLSTLTATRFLEKIREKEGAVELLIADIPQDPDSELLRDTVRPIPSLLKAFNHQWGFQIEWTSLAANKELKKSCSAPEVVISSEARDPGKIKASGFFRALPVEMTARKLGRRIKSFKKFTLGLQSLASLQNRRCLGKILFSGNPSLLEPVRRHFSNIPTAYVRFAENYKDLLAAFQKKYFVINVPDAVLKLKNGELEKILKRIEKENRLVIKGKNFYPVLQGKIRRLYENELLRSLAFYHAAKQFLQKAKPDYLVFDEDVTEYQRALAYAARVCGIKTLVVAHGLPGGPWGFLPLVSDHMAVWGEYAVHILKEWDLAEERQIVTGCPKYDAIEPFQGIDQTLKKDICQEFGFDAGKPLILIVPGKFRTDPFDRFDGSGSTSTETLQTAHIFLEAARKVPGVNILFKFRGDAMENAVFKEMIFKKNSRPINFAFTHKGLALHYLRAADVMFNNCSSACLEAVLMKKPVVNMNFAYYENVFPFYETGLGALVKSEEDVVNLCSDLAERRLPLQDWVNQQEKLVKPFLFSRDRNSAGRVASFMKSRLVHEESGQPDLAKSLAAK